MSSSSFINVRSVTNLTFSDSSTYSGQVLDQSASVAVPFGWGILRTKEGFQHAGNFKSGKSEGEGRFQAPNGDVFYGCWNMNHKRQGKGLFIRGSDGLQLVEEYDDGLLIGKRVKRRAPAATSLYWHHGFFSVDGPNPGPRYGASLTLNQDGNMLVLIGGERPNSSGPAAPQSDVWIFDVQSRRWLQPAMRGVTLPPICGHTATLWGNSIIVVGGQSGGLGVNSSVFVLDLSSGVWSCPVQKGLSFVSHTASIIGNQLYIIVQSSVFQLDLNSWKWQELTEINGNAIDYRRLKRAPRAFLSHSATVIGGSKILVFGGKILGGVHSGEGKKYEKCTSEVRCFDVQTGVWEVIETSAAEAKDKEKEKEGKSDYSGFVKGNWDTPRCEHTATLVGNKLYIIGGWTSLNPAMNKIDESFLNDVQVLNIDTMQWEQNPVNPLVFPVPRAGHAVVQVGDELWVYGGRNAGAEQLDDWNRLNLPHKTAPNQQQEAE